MIDSKSVRFSPLTEQRLLAAALKSKAAREEMAKRLPQDAFVEEKHAVIWASIRECVRKDIEPDDASLYRFSSGVADLAYVSELKKRVSGDLDEVALQEHIKTQRWDAARMQTLRGPVNGFLEEAAKPNADPERVVALADQVSQSLRGYEDRRALHDPEQLAREVRTQLSEARSGRSIYPYGIDSLDFYENGHLRAGKPRCIPGTKPGQITVLTAVSGSGKSTVAARMALGAAKAGRRVLYGAWEPGAADTLQLMACMDLGLSRSDLAEGSFSRAVEDQVVARAIELGKMITIMDNPHVLDASGREKKPTSDRNVDVVAGYIADTGADIFIADLWERCLTSETEAEERLALFRIQRVLQRAKCHGILLAQQRLKDIEVRSDCRPTREGIKGTSAWVDVADTIIGVHMPSLFKEVETSKLELIILKQRWGVWPMAVEFDWDADRGYIGHGVTVSAKGPVLDGNDVNSSVDRFLKDSKYGR